MVNLEHSRWLLFNIGLLSRYMYHRYVLFMFSYKQFMRLNINGED